MAGLSCSAGGDTGVASNMLDTDQRWREGSGVRFPPSRRRSSPSRGSQPYLGSACVEPCADISRTGDALAPDLPQEEAVLQQLRVARISFGAVNILDGIRHVSLLF